MKFSYVKEFEEDIEDLKFTYLFYAKQQDKFLRLLKHLIKRRSKMEWTDDLIDCLYKMTFKELKEFIIEVIY